MSFIRIIVLNISSDEVTDFLPGFVSIMPSMMTLQISDAPELDDAEPLATGRVFSRPFSPGFL